MIRRKIAACFLLGLVCSSATAATYYVDATNGRDSYAGTEADPSSRNGPWQTLSRVSTASLLPGDSVLLKCGEVWHESLRILGSGTASNPIRIGSYPGGCTTYPVIDGSIPVPADSWSGHSGLIYRVKLPVPLISNGTFESDVGDWRKWSPSGAASISTSTDCVPAGTKCLAYSAGAGTATTALSSPRFGLVAAAYTLTFSIKAPAEASVRVVVRKDAAPWTPGGLDTRITGTGAWQSYSFVFSSGTVKAARLDFEVPANVSMKLDNVGLTPSVGTPHRIYMGDESMEPARHPNIGHDAARPLSPYATVAADSDVTNVEGVNVSTFVTTGSDLRLPPGASLTPGIGIGIRTRAWLLDERRVASVSGSRLYLNTPTTYDLKAGWGFYLTDALWMLDSPGESYFDRATSSYYVWAPDGSSPGDRFAVAFGDVGIDVSNQSHIVIEHIGVRRMSVGVRFAKGRNVTVRGMRILDSTNEGIDASGSTASTIQDTTIIRTGRDGIAGLNRAPWRMADGLRVIGNTVMDSGVHLLAGRIVSVPVRVHAAIKPGRRAYVYANKVINAGWIGIWARNESTVDLNYVRNACMVLDDCAGIYLGDSQDTTVKRNLVYQAPGAIDGKPDIQRYTQAQGIFLDDHVSGAVVTGNTAIGADHGLQIHNAFNNRVEGNTFYGNRKYQILVQEDSRSLRTDGDIHDNTIRGNVSVPEHAAPSILHTTIYGSTSDFATYSANIYSALISADVAREHWAGNERTFRFDEWRTAKDAAGASRNLDPDGRLVTLSGFASFRITGTNLIPNGKLASGMSGWSSWNASAPFGTLSLASCAARPCLEYRVGASAGVVSSANFAVVKDRWYRVSFDVLTESPDQIVRWAVRRGGGGTNLYESLMGPDARVYGSPTWKRHSHVFKATATINVNDPVTLDRGARLDFQNNSEGKRFWIANAELVEVSPVGTSVLKTNVIMNPTFRAELVNCPDSGADAVFCDKYVRLTDGAPIIWPHTLPPLGAEVIYSRGDTLVDTDGDSVADVQDACPDSPAGDEVDSRGCAIGQ